MRKLIASILFCIMLCQGGCQFVAQGAYIPQPTAELVVVDETAKYTQKDNGREYTQISENFDITVYPAEIVSDESERYSIHYNFAIRNKTQSTFANFQAIMRLDPSMEKFIQNAAVAFSPKQPTLVSKEAAQKSQGEVWGIQIENEATLVSQEQLKELGLSGSDMLPIARKMQLQLEWDGGSEYYEFDVDVLE